MLLKMYAVFDVKVNAYDAPFVARTDGEAIRFLERLVNGREHRFSGSPHDFTLFEIGTYDDTSAVLDRFTAPISKVPLKDLVKLEPARPDSVVN